eukprot:scaffold169859_cov33-Tisochrysis_lutea.AAC.6
MHPPPLGVPERGPPPSSSQAPHWTFVMHDGFRGYPSAWRGFMSGCPNKAMDAHVYQAWNR